MRNKTTTSFVCQSCTHQVPKWIGKCPECNEWNTFQEEVFISTKVGKKVKDVLSNDEKPCKVGDVFVAQHDRIKTTINEFDRVLGGGLVQGSLILIGGEPGIGKSTLLAEATGKLSRQPSVGSVLYVSGEESVGQVAERIKRLKVESDSFYVYHETSWQKIREQIVKLKPKFVVIDSIQTTVSHEIQSAPGTVSQIREVTYELMNYIKVHNVTCFIVGHVTKEGSIAGPKILEHMVDTVVYFEGDQFGHYRLLRAIKNRFGNTNEVGIFEMQEGGLCEIPNPSQYFLDDQLRDSYGRSLSCILEGTRTLFVEIQALVVENKFGNGRRTTQGLENNRLAMLVAIIEKYFGIPLGYNDIYLNVVGGIKLTTRDTDLSIIASLMSSYRGKPLDSSTIYLGEVGLTGEVRSIPQVEIRLKEIAQLNYKRVITSYKTAQKFKNKFQLEIKGVRTARELEDWL